MNVCTREGMGLGDSRLLLIWICALFTFLFNHHVVQYVLHIVFEDFSQPLNRKHKKTPRHHLFAKVPTPTCSSICLKKITNMFFLCCSCGWKINTPVGTELLGDRQAALCSMCIIGFYASVRLMVSWRQMGMLETVEDLLPTKGIRST